MNVRYAFEKDEALSRARWMTAIGAGIEEEIAAHKFVQEVVGQQADNYVTQEYLEELHGEMLAAAANLEFERAAQLRDRIAELKGQATAAPQVKKRRGRFSRGSKSRS